MPLPTFASLSASSGAMLALLISAHVLSDFLFQSERVATGKESRTGPLLEHGVAVFATHLVVLAPFASVELTAWLFGLCVLHTAQDAARSRAFGERGRTLGAFAADQALHLGFAVALWAILASRGVDEQVVSPAVGPWLPWIGRAALVVAGFVFNLRGGSTIVQRTLERFPTACPDGDPGDQYRMGRVIGYLERALVYALILNGQWGALGLVIAAKSVARFPELKTKAFADYYLIGTLASMVVAVGVGLAVRLVI
ncbi:MAG: DUF3307 domain-containing protein [Candidatus Eisenbacteria bacterium]|nr:DUF3307 domain-containing protein [Candidatus Eisenbacteria bacterium]